MMADMTRAAPALPPAGDVGQDQGDAGQARGLPRPRPAPPHRAHTAAPGGAVNMADSTDVTQGNLRLQPTAP
jgi:hypothetical protein